MQTIEKNCSEKRNVSMFAPFCRRNGEVFVFLQKRSKTATRLPDYFGFWGGGIDAGETPEQCLEREIKEELNIEIESYTFLGRYEFLRKIAFVFYKEMDDGFESKITILEGDYGKWFSQQDIEKEPFLIHEDKTILLDIFNKTRL